MATPRNGPDRPPPDVAITQPGRIRRLGPVVALALPAGLGTLGLLVLALWPCAGRSCVEPSLAAWLLVLFALPTALAVGHPWWVTPLTVGAAVVTSVVLWAGLGAMAARRAAAETDAGWAAFGREFLPLAAGVVAGVLLGLGLIAVWLRV